MGAPTGAAYLGRVTKGRILQAVVEARGQRAADRIAHLKKGDMASEAEALLAGSGWLPEALRPIGGDAPEPAVEAEPANQPEAAIDDDAPVEGDEDAVQPVAAE